MNKELYVGNLSYSINNQALESMFAAYGTVRSAKVIIDRDTGQSKGFAFVQMSTDSENEAAINALNGKDIDGKTLVVNEARSQQNNGGNNHRGGGNGGGRRGGGNYGGGGRRY